MSKKTRRNFIKKVAGSGIVAAALPSALHATQVKNHVLTAPSIGIAPSDQIRLGAIGMGIQGYNDVNAALNVPGVQLTAVSDLYQGRLDSCKENYSSDLYTSRNYKDILDRDDIDAVIIATSDHWHDRITIDALKAGKHVYCEKPMVHKLEEGKAVIEAEKSTGKVLEIGSQGVSSIVTEKAAEIYKSGAIGQLIMAETYNDRQSSLGAWNYSIPTDASAKTIDWKSFLGDAPKRDYDAKRFFRWRNYNDYGTGVAGDLFVHLFSGLHVVLDTMGPDKIYASGGLRYWKDGRDAPDVMLAVVDYGQTATHPAFNLQIRVNFVDGGGGGGMTKLVGSEGTLTLGGNNITIKKNKMSDTPGYGGWDSFGTFTKQQQQDYEKWYNEKYPKNHQVFEPSEQIFQAPRDYSSHTHHFANFFDAMRTGGKVVEDGSFGLRAAGPALSTNLSYFNKEVVNWDPIKMEVI